MQARLLQPLLAEDQLGLHRRVGVVLRHPGRYSLREREVVERMHQFRDRPIDLQHLIDRARVPCPLRPHQADVERRELRVLQPCAEEIVAPPQAESNRIRGRLAHHALHLCAQLRGGPLVGVQQEDPGMLERNPQRRIAVRRVVVECSAVHLRADRARNLHRRVCAARVEDMHIVRPRDRGQRASQIALFVLRKDQHGDHCRELIANGIAVPQAIGFAGGVLVGPQGLEP